MESRDESVGERLLRNLKQLGRFGIVGASGVLVNLVIVAALDRSGPVSTALLADLPGTDFNMRWYHAYVAAAFMVANVWNYQLNRSFTFTGARPPWLRGYRTFLGVGVMGLVGNLLIVTALMHPDSPVHLSSALSIRTEYVLMAANAIAIVLVTPLTFVLSKTLAFQDTQKRRLVATRAIA